MEEFGTLDGVMINFEKWKFAHVDTYTEAFVPLCLPKIFGVFVKLALLRWNPLEVSFLIFIKMNKKIDYQTICIIKQKYIHSVSNIDIILMLATT